MSTIKHIAVFLFFSLLIIISYIELSHFWVSCGGIDGKNRYIEFPLLVFLLLMLYFPRKTSFKNILLAVLPILGLYILYDVFYYFLARSPRLSDLKNAIVLNDFSTFFSAGLSLMFLAILTIMIYAIYDFKKHSTNRTFYAILFAKIMAFIGFFYYLSSTNFDNYLSKKFDYYCWSQAKTITKNGRFSSVIYYTIMSNKAKEKLITYKEKKIDINALLFDDVKIKNRKNIYMVVLESFIDPRLIKDAIYSPSPLHKKMQKYLTKKEFSYTLSPIYGGGTSQAEFEVLTAIPALAAVNSIEFNTLQGNQIAGFVNMLKQNGYTPYANIATNSNYFNSKEAYKSIGFDKTVFLEESDGFLQQAGDKHIFDGDVYHYNISKLKKQSLKSPYLLYTLGMYGHFPYDRNLKLRPDVIETSYHDKRVKRIANQFYYRTKALANYIEAILSFDPNSIIFITSDHIPPLLNKGVRYLKQENENIALLLIDGKMVDINGLHYYDIPRVIDKILNNSHSTLKQIGTKVYQDIYFKALSQSL